MTHKLNRLTALVLAVVMAFSMLLVPASAASFHDVSENAWYKAAVDYVQEKGWMAGVSDTSFAPNKELTRGMMVTVLARVAEAETNNETAAFTDTASGKWFTGAAAWAAENGIAAGVGEGLFAPNRALTRQDLCVMLYKYISLKRYELENTVDRSFSDMESVSDYARDAVIYCTGTGLVSGFEDSSFRPRATATRAQVAQLMMRLDLLVKGETAPTEPMPAQSFEGEAGEDMAVSVNAPEGALPENTKMTVSRVTDEAALAAIQAKVNGELYAAADITFTKDSAELEPSADVEVQISLEGLENIQNPTVVHVRPDGNVEYVEAELVNTNRSGSEKALRFYAKDFSVYAVIGGEGVGSTLTITFYARENGSTGAWQPVNKQILRADQLGEGKYAISDPGVPNITTSQAFEGWALEGIDMPFNPNYSYTADTETYSVKQINDYHNSTPLTTNTEVACYAAVFDVVYITYHDQAGAVIYAEYKKLVEGAASADVQLAYNPFKDNQNFSGWVTENYVNTIGSIDGTMPVYNEGAYEAKWEVGTTQTITASVDLYPYVEEGFWLIFDNNIAGNNEAFGYNDDVYASYTPSEFVGHGRRVTEPTAPTRAGYDFGGWYTDKAMTTAFIWGSETNPVYLTEETTLYAKWNRLTTADYTVVIWTQRVSDDMNAADADKTYDYYFSTKLSGATGATVANLSDVTYFQSYHTNPNSTALTKGLYLNAKPDESGAWKYIGGFHYLKTKPNYTTIKSNGSTVVNVYWDRDIVTYRFYSSSYSEYPSYRQSGLYGAEVPSWPSDEVMWNLTSDGGVPSSSNTSNSYISISKIFSFYGQAILRTDKTVYFYAETSSVSNATLRHFIEKLDTNDETYYPTTAEATVYMPYINGHTFREFKGHSDDMFRVKLPSASGYYRCTYEGTSTGYDSSGYYTGSGPYAYYTAPFYYQLVTAVSGTGTSATVTTTGSKIQASSTNSYWTDWIPSTQSLIITDKNGKILFTPAIYGEIGKFQAHGLAIDFRYKLVKDTVKYLYGKFVDANGDEITTQYAGTIHTSGSYYYGQDITTAGNYTPAVPGYVFVGWYSSPECDADSSFSFSGEKMPEDGVTVYAKFQLMSFRVICDPTDDGKVTDVSFPGAQATMFCLDYGEKVSGTALNAATAPGKILLGWYTDKECTKPFSFSTPITDTIDGMDMTYATATNKSGVDPWNNNKAYTDDDTVVGKLVLYAKWREDPEGVIGIKVRYLGDHADNDKGYFDTNGKPHTLTMEEVFTDQALAAAYSASIPSLMNADTVDENRRFLYWEILDKNGNPTGKTVYPGAPFTVDINDAVEIKTPLPDPNCDHSGPRTHYDAVAPTCTEPGYPEHWKCDNCGKCFDAATGGNFVNPIPALGHNWGTPSYTWAPETLTCESGASCTGTAVCGRDSSHTLTQTVTATWVEDVPATNAAAGSGHYVATFTNTDVFTEQNSQSVEIPKINAYMVSYTVANGQAPETQSVVPGSSVTLPDTWTGKADPAGWTFVGWVLDDVAQTTQAQTALTGSYTPNSDVTLKALYMRSEETGGTYTRVTSSQSNWAGNYVITYGRDNSLYAMKGLENNQWYEGYEYGGTTPYASTGMSRSNNTLSNVSKYYVFTIAKNGSSYTIKNMATGAYLAKYEYVGYGVEPYAVSEAFPSYTDYIKWTIAYASAGNVTLTNSYTPTTETDYPMLGFDTTRHYFWMGESGKYGTDGIYLWKETTAPSTTTYYTTNASALNSYTVSFSVPSGVTTPDSMTVSSGKSVVLPNAAAPSNNVYFIGWATSAVTDTTTAPTYYASGALYKPTANLTLYAVYGYQDTYYKLLTAKPSSVDGYYVISSGTTPDCYMMLTRNSAGTMEETSYKTKISDSTAVISTLNGNTVIRHVPNNNRFFFGTWNSSYTSYYYIENFNGYFLYDANASSSSYYLAVCSDDDAVLNTGAWNITANSGKFLLNPYNYSSHNMSYSSTTETSTTGVFGLYGTSAAGVNLWQRTTDYHYVSNPASSSNIPGTVEIETQKGELVERHMPGFEAQLIPEGPVEAEPLKAEGPTADRAAAAGEENADLQSASGSPNPINAASDKYEIVTSLTPGKKILITNGTYIMSTTLASSTWGQYGQRFTAASAGNNQYTISLNNTTYADDADELLFTVGGSNNAWTFSNATAGYLNFTDDDYPSFGADNNTWSLDGAKLKNNKSGSSYPYLYFKTGTNYYYYSANELGNDLTFYQLVEDTAPTTYTVGVASSIANGTVTADKSSATAGETVTLTVNPDSGYEIGSVTYTPAGGSATVINPVNGAYSFTMPSANVLISATFTVSSGPSTTTTELWVPTYTIVPGDEYLIGFVVDGNTYLAVNYSENNSNHYYYSNSSNYYGYTALADLDDRGYVTAVSGSTSDLTHCIWQFSTTTGGTITSGYQSSYCLRTYSATTYHDLYPDTSSTNGTNWVWNSTAKTLTRSVGGTTMYAEHVDDGSSGHYMGMYTSRTESEYVQLYKKETITVYNVTVNTAANGNVRTDHSTALAGDTVRLTLTPSEGYEIDTVTVTASNGTAIELTNVSGGIYTFTMPAANVTVSATFKQVVTDDVWVVAFADEDGRDIPGMNDIFVPKDSNTLNENDLPNPAKDEYYFLGWYQGNTECTFPLTVNSNLVLTPKYSPMYSYDYTLTLRAVYGPFNPDATTHIYWYANNGTEDHNGAGERYVSEYKVTEGGVTTTTTRLPINAQVDIPLPSGSANQTVFVGDNGGALTWDDHVFLGWARVDNTGNEGEEQSLTEENLYLKWNGSKYLVKDAQSGQFVELSSQKVYADETTPYHDMYAVWTGYAYVYHSATGKIEAVEVKRGTTVDLVDKVPSDCLYGGYYTEYGGVKNVTPAAMRTAKDLAVQNAYAVDHNGGSADRLVAVSGSVNYTGAMSFSDSGTNVKFWTRAKAFGYGKQAEAPSGDKLVPEVGTVYYLKEVPETYLTTKFLYTYDKDKENEIQDFFMLTLVDDSNYGRVGFRTVQNAETVEAAARGEIVDRQSLASYFTLTQKNHDPVTVNAASFGLSSGYVGVKQYNDYIAAGKSFTLMPAWETYDGVEVNSHGTLKLTVDAAKTSISYSPLGSVTTPFTTMYVKLNDNVKSDWLYYDENDHTKLTKTRLYFFNDAAGTNAWVDMSSVDGTDNSVWTAPIPEGNWEAFIVVRCNPDNTLSGWDAKWNQTGNITFNSRAFNLVTITGSSGYETDYNYTTGVYGQSNP